MKILTYNDLKVTLLRATDAPAQIVKQAVNITMRQEWGGCHASRALCRFLLDAEHTSVFEHIVYTFLIENVSRSFLAQITRQRMSSFTSASQHYQDYCDYPCIVSPDMKQYLEENANWSVLEENANWLVLDDIGGDHILAAAFSAYEEVMGDSMDPPMPREEARQVLPNAAAVAIMWTINARSLALFLRHRLCNRNVAEMKNFAETVLSLVSGHFPELFLWVRPQCFDGSCKQGHLRCEEGKWR